MAEFRDAAPPLEDTPMPPRPTRNELGDVRDQKPPVVFRAFLALLNFADKGFEHLGKGFDILGAIFAVLVLIVFSPILVPLAMMGWVGDTVEKKLEK